MISHLSVITDDFGQTAQFYMARTDHHCEYVVQPVLNHPTCMQTWCTALMHHCMKLTNLSSPWPEAQTAKEHAVHLTEESSEVDDMQLQS